MRNTALVMVLLIALLVRILGTVPGHNYYHPDEPMSYDSAMTMIMNGDINPRRFDYPAGVPLLHNIVFQNVILPPVMFGVFLRQPGATITAITRGQKVFWDKYSSQIFGKGELHALYWSRIITALLGVFSVALVYMIGRELFSGTLGLVAAAFLAVNYRHVLSSHLALSDIPNGFFALLSFYTTVLLWEKPTLFRYLASAIAIALSLSMKYQIYSLLPFLFIHLWWVVKKRTVGVLFNKYVFTAAVLIVTIFVIINPYLFLNLDKTAAAARLISTRYQAGIWQLNAYPLFFLYHWGIGAFPSIAVILGLLIGSFIFPFQTMFLLSYVGPFLFTFLYYLGGGTYVRNFTSVIPFLCLFAGVLVLRVCLWLQKGVGLRLPQWFLVVFVFLLSLTSVRDSLMLDAAYLQPWAREMLADWIMKNVPDNSDILNDNTAVPSNLTKPLSLTPWSRDVGNSVTTLILQNRDFAVLNVNWNQMYFFEWFSWPFSRLFSFADTPYSFLRETYHGLLLGEYLRYTVHEVYKYYQAPDDAYLVMKIPQPPESLGRKIQEFHFLEGLEGWRFFDFRKNLQETGATWNTKNGYISPGSLELAGSKADFNFTRVVSPFIPVTAGNVYTLTAHAKTDEARDSIQKDGFFRIDFFASNRDELLQTSSYIAVSDALFGPEEWKKEEIIAEAPSGARYLTISFQRSNPLVSNHYWIDDIDLFESAIELKDKFPNLPYITPTIPDNVIFPNSIY